MNHPHQRRKNDTFVPLLVERMNQLGPIRSRAMFGGHGFWCGVTFFAIAFHGRLYFKVSDATRPDYEAANCEPFRLSRRQSLSSYYEVPGEVLADTELLRLWARGAITAASREDTTNRRPKAH